MCISARANTLTEKVTFLQNAAFGYVYLFGLVPLDSPFCEIDKNTCTNMQIGPQNDQKCSKDAALQPGQEFCSCSNIAVPGAALPGVSKLTSMKNGYWTTVLLSAKLHQRV